MITKLDQRKSVWQNPSWLQPADQLLSSEKTVQEKFDLEPAQAEDLSLGAKVIHKNFGKGVIEEFEGQGANRKVIVSFEQDQNPRKLILKYAKLALE